MLPQDTDRPVAQSVALVPVNYNSLSNRAKTLVLWALITVLLPFAQVVMLLQILFGSNQRAHNQAVAYDEAGNTIFGGPPTQTMSSRVGDAEVLGQKWAKVAAPILDFFFGKGHALANVTLPESQISAANKVAVDKADSEQGDDATYEIK